MLRCCYLNPFPSKSLTENPRVKRWSAISVRASTDKARIAGIGDVLVTWYAVCGQKTRFGTSWESDITPSPLIVTVSFVSWGQSWTAVFETTLAVVIHWILQKKQEQHAVLVARTFWYLIFVLKRSRGSRTKKEKKASSEYVKPQLHFGPRVETCLARFANAVEWW